MDEAVLDVATPNPPGEDIQEAPEQQKVSGMPRGGFSHGRPGQPPGAALFHKTWGAARALKKKSSGPRSGFPLSIISLCVELANWRPLQLQAPLLAKKVPWTDPE